MMAACQALFFISLLLMMIFVFRVFNHHPFLSSVFNFFLASSFGGALITLTFYYCQPSRFPLPAEP